MATTALETHKYDHIQDPVGRYDVHIYGLHFDWRHCSKLDYYQQIVCRLGVNGKKKNMID